MQIIPFIFLMLFSLISYSKMFKIPTSIERGYKVNEAVV